MGQISMPKGRSRVGTKDLRSVDMMPDLGGGGVGGGYRSWNHRARAERAPKSLRSDRKKTRSEVKNCTHAGAKHTPFEE
jgi:hypothetical protein